MVFGREVEDWKELLSEDAKQTLAELFESAKRHKGAYTAAGDVKVAQLWSALVEVKKDLAEVKETLGKVEGPWRAIVSVGEAEKRKTIERLVTEIIRPTEEETAEATKRLVDSLMKF